MKTIYRAPSKLKRKHKQKKLKPYVVCCFHCFLHKIYVMLFKILSRYPSSLEESLVVSVYTGIPDISPDTVPLHIAMGFIFLKVMLSVLCKGLSFVNTSSGYEGKR